MANKTNSPTQIIRSPTGGGALKGIGEKFAPDLHTGTGNFPIPIDLPAGRNGFQPQLSLVYSTGNGNGICGLGWNFSIPGITRQTSRRVPTYYDYNLKEQSDIFILSGAEDLVPLPSESPLENIIRYRPRTEGLFARIEHHHDAQNDYWEVYSKDGLRSIYGTPELVEDDPATIVSPDSKKFAWKITETRDPFNNLIQYVYGLRDAGTKGGHQWDQPLLTQIRYGDYSDGTSPAFLVTVDFSYEERVSKSSNQSTEYPDAFSDYRVGFEIRTSRRCHEITIRTHADKARRVRTYKLVYQQDPLNGVSLLSQVHVIGYDDDGQEAAELPPLEFRYTQFAPEKRRFIAVQGRDLPGHSLADQNFELVDLHGAGLPDVIQMNGTVRYWHNLGGGCFDLPRFMSDAPSHTLGDPGVQMLDANGDGRAELMVTTPNQAGYYPLSHHASWDRRSFQKYKYAPSFNLEDPEVRLIDLNGDGVTDAIRSGTSLECAYNDPHEGWHKLVPVRRKPLDIFPNVNFSDPRVKLGDMTGDGLQDIVLIHDGSVDYWPNLGYGRWGKRLHMRCSPRYTDPGYSLGYDPKRILLGDVDGDGLADIVYVGNQKVTLWINQSGNGWSAPIEISGTPSVTDMDAVRLVDLMGTGVSGVLWSRDAQPNGRPHMYFLDFTGGVKPYLLNEIDNHMGAITKVNYVPSTQFYLEDQKHPSTRWKTPLPFPVQVVERVEVIDSISYGKLTTQYRYHHGYWDGAEREFRGFGMVEQIDTEVFEVFNQHGLHGTGVAFHNYRFPKGKKQFSPPVLTKTWFHQGPIGEEFGDWEEIDRSHEYWQGDPELLDHTGQVNQYLRSLGAKDNKFTRRARRDALRTLRGSILRTELYALERVPNQDRIGKEDRPYTVTEHAYGLEEISPHDVTEQDRMRIFFPHVITQRTTQWERGYDPMTQFSFVDYHDDEGKFDLFGRPHQQTTVAMPRRLAKRYPVSGSDVTITEPDEARILATHTWTSYAEPDTGKYIYDRVAQTETYELEAPPTMDQDNLIDPNSDHALAELLSNQYDKAKEIRQLFLTSTEVKLIGHVLNYYDGREFEGLDIDDLIQYGALTRSQALVFTGELLDSAYADSERNSDRRPIYLGCPDNLPDYAPANFGTNTGYALIDGTSPHAAVYYADTKRVKFDFQDTSISETRGVVIAIKDALGHETKIQPDEFWFLPVRVTDSAGLETTASYNYRVLQPSNIEDPNGNETHFCYSPLGLLKKQYLRSRDGKGGTELEPEIEYSYDFLAYKRTHNDPQPQPISVHTHQRIWHASDDDVSDEIIESREYSDGFGRLIQKRVQAEETIFGDDPDKPSYWTGDDVGLLLVGGNAKPLAIARRIPDCVAVSGWQRYDNKGRVVEKYEPFFDEGWDFQPEEDAKRGVHVEMYYDPRGQVIRTVNPDGSEQRVIFGVPGKIGTPDAMRLDDYEPTPWESYTYDGNDLASISFDPDATEPDGSPKSLTDRAPQSHHYTPTSTILNAQGKVICQIERNGLSEQEWYITRSEFDVRGNLLMVWDALGREAFKHAYDLLNRPLRVDSIDAGLRTSVLDAQGNLIEYRDSKGAVVLREYDALNRPCRVWAKNNSKASSVTLRERIEYGDKGKRPQTESEKAERNENREKNALGRPIEHWDEAGVLHFRRYDFKGNLVEKSRQVISDTTLNQVLQDQDWVVDWINTDPVTVLETLSYQTTMSYDALNRPVEIVYPTDVNGQRAHLKLIYNRAGALESVTLDNATYVEHIAYNAKGQRVLIEYGNHVVTRYAYDPQTFRLLRLRTQKLKSPQPSELKWEMDERYLRSQWLFQDFTYEYDLAGNITLIHDCTPNSGLPTKPDELKRFFEYDPSYRLTRATGRQCDQPPPQPFWDDSYRCTDPTLTTDYIQHYGYDAAGNLTELVNRGSNTAIWFTRTLNLSPDRANNRLANVEVGGTVFGTYAYDDSGNMTQEGEARFFIWDHADHMIGFTTKNGTGVSIEARYLYDASGIRVKKWIRKNGALSTDESTTYIDSIFEHHRWQENNTAVQNNHLHVMDDQSRVAIIRVGLKHPYDGGEGVQYHLGDHLGSSNIVIGGTDATACSFMNREEYFPYGETSFGSYGKKCYRFTGKERDEYSSLYYQQARYYAPWLGRWISCDPLGMESGTNLYSYVSNNPYRFTDPEGTQERTWQDLANQPLFDIRDTDWAKIRGQPTLSAATTEQAHSPEFIPPVYKPRDPFMRQWEYTGNATLVGAIGTGILAGYGAVAYSRGTSLLAKQLTVYKVAEVQVLNIEGLASLAINLIGQFQKHGTSFEKYSISSLALAYTLGALSSPFSKLVKDAFPILGGGASMENFRNLGVQLFSLYWRETVSAFFKIGVGASTWEKESQSAATSFAARLVVMAFVSGIAFVPKFECSQSTSTVLGHIRSLVVSQLNRLNNQGQSGIHVE